MTGLTKNAMVRPVARIRWGLKAVPSECFEVDHGAMKLVLFVVGIVGGCCRRTRTRIWASDVSVGHRSDVTGRGTGSGVRDKHGHELEFPSAFRQSRRDGKPRG